jgi:DNA-binding IclR family transcriptional regulator
MRHLRGEVIEPDTAIATAPPGVGRAAPPADGAARAYNIAAVDRALDLLEALARIGPASLAALSQEAGCTRTAGFRLLRTMQARGFAIQDHARGLWRLGARWSMLSRAAAGQGALAATAQPFLASLAEAVNENTYFITRAGLEGEVIALHRADPNLRVYVELGKPFALHAGPGRLLLAYAPESVLTQVLARKLARFTPTTRIEPAWIMADLQRLRARHWISTADEMFAGGVSIAATVCDASGDVVGALVIAAPALRMRPPRPRSLLPILEETAAAMSEALGAPSRNPAAGTEPMRALGAARPLTSRPLSAGPSAGAPAHLSALSRDG